MNIPVLLIIIRISLTPIIFIAILFEIDWLPAYIYLLGLLTDSIDGKIACNNSMSSAFQEAMDSPTDKVFVAATMIGLMQVGKVSSTLVFLFVFREIIILGIRGIKFKTGNVAKINNNLGRIRFFILHLGLLVLLFPTYYPQEMFNIANYLVIISMIMAYITFTYYLYTDRKAIIYSIRELH